MAGYKRTVQDSNPAGFWTFDGEPYDINSRLFTHSPLVIFDESANANDGILMVGNEQPEYAYRAGMASLVAQEPALQSCLCVGAYGKVNGIYPKAIVQIPHISVYDTTQSNGSFTIALLFNKLTDEGAWRAAEYPSGQWYANLTKTIISKPGMFQLSINDAYANNDSLVVTFPNGTTAIPIEKIPNFYGTTHHVVARWTSSPGGIGGGDYTGTATLIVDGVTVLKKSTEYSDVAPSTSVSTQPFEIGGVSASSSIFDDRATSRTFIDQIAFWTRAIENIEVWRLFKKVWNYQDMVMKKAPSIYIPFEDDLDTTTTSVFMAAGSNLASYHIGDVARARPGPPNIPGSRSLLFSRATHVIKYTSSGSATSPINLDPDNYAIEMWLKTAANQRAVIMSMQGNDKPYVGPLMEINVNSEGSYANGVITYRENESAAVSSTANDFLNDGAFVHVVVQRREGKYLEIFVNGELKSSKMVPKQGINAQYSLINLMGSPPGNLYCDGSIAHFAIYNGKTFEDFEAATRYQFTTIYRVRGVTTLRAAPYNARVRLYHYRSGELLAQQDSQAADGSFTFYLKDNSLVASQILSMNDSNVRVRGFGPIIPAEIPDPY
jgi:hypothetical protein